MSIKYLPLVPFLFSSIGCASPEGKPYELPPLFRCSDVHIPHNVEYMWPSDDAGIDDNGDGQLSVAEHLSSWDMRQMIISLDVSAPNDWFSWTNPSTCYTITIQSGEVFEDETKGLLYKQACRLIRFEVTNNKDVYIGIDQAVACRHITTFEWQIF